MTTFIIQVSNHPEAGWRIPTEAGAASWTTVYDGAARAKDVRTAVDQLAKWYRHARCFKGKAIGRFHYGVFQ